ncbi:hypothetical protein Hamer_G002332 [Homarus americanus]|uniref:Uncharacterized protein n=1 Tax=Homarus americanus TaxID=6706 RepID=A0A8J5K7F4_HOMAM|nr:hypothetical protein Hamer_G002332 [Homarus americanus]
MTVATVLTVLSSRGQDFQCTQVRKLRQLQEIDQEVMYEPGPTANVVLELASHDIKNSLKRSLTEDSCSTCPASCLQTKFSLGWTKEYPIGASVSQGSVIGLVR